MKWSGFDEDAATWEPSQNVPKFVQAYYKKDPTRLGRKIPNPVIKHSKKVGNTKYHFLSWEGEKLARDLKNLSHSYLKQPL